MKNRVLIIIKSIFLASLSYVLKAIQGSLYIMFIDRRGGEHFLKNEGNVRVFLENILKRPDDYFLSAYERTLLRQQRKRTKIFSHSFFLITNISSGENHTLSYFGTRFAFHSQGAWALNAVNDIASYFSYVIDSKKWDTSKIDINIDTPGTVQNILEKMDSGVTYFFPSHVRPKTGFENCNTALWDVLAKKQIEMDVTETRSVLRNTGCFMPGNIRLNYPVVLVHGIVAYDGASVVKFWGRIPEVLRNRGIEVFFGNTDAWGDYESNASILKNTIEHILRKTKKEKVNIIAHSKGGIDSRYLVWKYDFGDKIASVITICTPHKGAEIADLIYSRKNIQEKLKNRGLLVFGKLLGETNPNFYNVNYQLTTANMEEFNKKVIADDRVFYQSLYTTMDSALDDLMFFYSYLYIKKHKGKSDGIVSEYSASWGNNILKIHGGISHTEIIDIQKKKISGINIPDIYVAIVRELERNGF